jgi:hypothetical protein
MAVTVAFGPENGAPSWEWVGADIANELCKYYNVLTYKRTEVPAADVIFFIKHIPRSEQFEEYRATGAKLVFVPIDYFRDESHINEYRGFLSNCDLIVAHAQSLVGYFQPHAPTHLIEHHGKYFLPELHPYRSDGYALWVGGVENVPPLLEYIEQNPLEIELRILTNLQHPQMRKKAKNAANRNGIPMKIDGDRLNGFQTYPWSVGLQADMFREARVAIDIKGASFNQQNKPPTKAQQFVASGIPIAMNSCGVSSYFAQYGLTIPAPQDARWLSIDYHEEVQKIAPMLRSNLTLPSIGSQYKKLVERVLQVPGWRN